MYIMLGAQKGGRRRDMKGGRGSMRPGGPVGRERVSNAGYGSPLNDKPMRA